MASKPNDLERTLAPLLVGGVLSCISSGLVLSLATTYFTRFNSDGWWIKSSVFGLTLLGLVGSGVDTSWVYSWTVTHFLNPQELDHTPWELAAYHFLNGLVVVIVQAFYLWRTWLTSGRSKAFLRFAVMPVSIVSFACFGLSVYMTALLSIGGPHDIQFDRLREVSYGWYSGVLSVDLFICVTMLNHLVYRTRPTPNLTMKSSSSDIARRDELRQATKWRLLSNRIFHTNSISLAVQAIVLALFVSRSNGLQYTVFAFFSPKIYIISVLATFNSRSPHGNGALDPIETFTLDRFKSRHVEAPVRVVVEHEMVDEIGEDEEDFEGTRRGRIDLNGSSEVGNYQVTFDRLRGGGEKSKGGEKIEFEMAKFA